MRAFDFVRVVLYDKSTATREPLVLYDASAGLTGRDLMRATKHFEFLLNHDFKLYRTSGDLGIDPKGDQRMEMIGIHNRMRNAHAPPNKNKKRKLDVINSKGDLDAYVIHYDHDAFASDTIQKTFDALSTCIRKAMPRMWDRLGEVVKECGVKDRMLTSNASEFVSHDMRVLNVGVSAAYQSPAHCDRSDVGWTIAASCKCGEKGCERCMPCVAAS